MTASESGSKGQWLQESYCFEVVPKLPLVVAVEDLYQEYLGEASDLLSFLLKSISKDECFPIDETIAKMILLSDFGVRPQLLRKS